MNLPETCQFCGAGVNERSPHGRWVTFRCYSWVLKDNDPRHNQSQWCEKAERARLSARVAELEARCKRLTKAAREVYLDSIASDHPWSTNETRNMHALRDALEAKP